ncbi:MAG: MarR family transcriptional regulator [Chitinispirillaceae bacterium]|nr:MarR family transcriptional regulator [Chitinispirillaceae bacterium]
MISSDERLKLRNQLCFPLYAASRLITREYQPYLEKMNITYPQYLVLLVLWEDDGLTVNEIAHKLILNTNTVTPLLKRMESEGIISRERTLSDERKVLIMLTEKGKEMKKSALLIPEQLSKDLLSGVMDLNELVHLKGVLEKIIGHLSGKQGESTCY